MTPRAWKRLFSRIVLWIGIVTAAALLLVLGGNTWTMYGKNQEAAQAHFDEADQLSELQTRHTALSGELSALDTQRGVEAEIRQKYPVARKGEEVIVLTDNPQAASSTPARAGWDMWRWLTSLFP